METEFISNFKVGNSLRINNQNFIIKNLRSTESFYDINSKSSAGKQLEVELINNHNEIFHLLVFLETEEVVFNKRVTKLNYQFSKLFKKELLELKENQTISYQNKLFQLKNILKKSSSIQYILISYINEQEKESMSIYIKNNMYDINIVEIKKLNKKDIFF